MLNRVIPVASLLAIAVLLVILIFTTPTEIGPFGVLLFFMLVYLVMLGAAAGLIWLLRRVMGKKGEMKRKDYYYAVLLAFAPIMLLLAQSMGSLGWFTILLTGLFVALGSFLIYKRV